MANKIDYKKIFLEKRTLGRKTYDSKEPKGIIKKCCKLAYSDMMASGKYYIAGNKKENIISKFINELEEKKFKFSRELINYCSILIGECIKGKEDTSKINNNYVTNYGLAQKLVNMTFKYLYVFSDKCNVIIEQELDCPIDSVILESLEKTNYKWSKLTESEYVELQENIKDKLKSDEKYTKNKNLKKIGNLAYDFLHW